MRRDEATGEIDRLYEYYQVDTPDGGKTWHSAGGAQFDLKTGAPRRDGWTSADAAGLPIEPLLVRYDEIERGRSTIRSAWPFPWGLAVTDTFGPPVTRSTRALTRRGSPWEPGCG